MIQYLLLSTPKVMPQPEWPTLSCVSRITRSNTKIFFWRITGCFKSSGNTRDLPSLSPTRRKPFWCRTGSSWYNMLDFLISTFLALEKSQLSWWFSHWIFCNTSSSFGNAQTCTNRRMVSSGCCISSTLIGLWLVSLMAAFLVLCALFVSSNCLWVSNSLRRSIQVIHFFMRCAADQPGCSWI